MKIIINQGREILLLGSVRESIMTPSETSSEKNIICTIMVTPETMIFFDFFQKNHLSTRF
jgi:hypothetical protein